MLFYLVKVCKIVPCAYIMAVVLIECLWRLLNLKASVAFDENLSAHHCCVIRGQLYQIQIVRWTCQYNGLPLLGEDNEAPSMWYFTINQIVKTVTRLCYSLKLKLFLHNITNSKPTVCDCDTIQPSRFQSNEMGLNNCLIYS